MDTTTSKNFVRPIDFTHIFLSTSSHRQGYRVNTTEKRWQSRKRSVYSFDRTDVTDKSKHGKGRLDKYYHLAKEKGYRARAAFKLIQLNKKYSFLQKSKCLIDLCAAPGSWLQVAAQTMPVKSLIVGVDLAPIKPIPKTISFQGDITTEKCRAALRGYLKTWKADTVIHDGAPNVGTAWVQDAYSQNELVLCSLKLATEFLTPGGTFVTKVFRSKDSSKLEWTFKQLFNSVEQTKPPSSRNVSAETFYVCRGYKAPKQLDPRFLDPKYAFAEVDDAAPNNEAKVFNPEKKKRKREGYAEGDHMQFNSVPASEFIQTTDPIKMLGELNKLDLTQQPNGDIALATIDKLPETTNEIRDCCADLKVLGRKEFKLLLRWRLKVRERFGFPTKAKAAQQAAKDKEEQDQEVAQVESMDEEMALQADIQALKDANNKVKRKERRRENEKKNKDIVRMQLNMTTPSEIGIEQAGPYGQDAIFQLKGVDKAGLTGKVSKGQMYSATDDTNVNARHDASDGEESDDDLGDTLEGELDSMYDQYQSRREERDAKARAKRARKKFDDEFEGLSDKEQDDDASDDGLVANAGDSDDSSDDDEHGEALVTDLDSSDAAPNRLTKRATQFFDQDIFKGISGLVPDEPLDRDSGIDMQDSSSASPPHKHDKQKALHSVTKKDTFQVDEASDAESASDAGFETVKTTTHDDSEDDFDADADRAKNRSSRPNIDIITAEAMTLAHQLATGKKTKTDLLDENYNKYSLRDVDGLPDWFLDDEDRHAKPHRPITKEAASAIKEKQRALNARPIKKVREAKARKTLRAATRLEKLKKKSALLADSEDVSEKDKAGQIARIMSRAAKSNAKKKLPVKVVVARGGNKGSNSRPAGVKGKYKMVDARMKKDVRGEKRLKKRIAGKK